MNNAAKNVHVQVFLWTYVFISLGFPWGFYTLVAKLWVVWLTVFSLKKSPDCFPVIAAFYILTSGMRVPLFLLTHQHLLLAVSVSEF